jgi:hypothetical protein
VVKVMLELVVGPHLGLLDIFWSLSESILFVGRPLSHVHNSQNSTQTTYMSTVIILNM